MKKLLLIIIASTALLMMVPDTAQARWRVGFHVFYDNCPCYWGEPDPWDPWWECPCYWDVWQWCMRNPYWMWPRWARRWVEFYYSPCGRYYYVYYDRYVPHSRRVYVHGRYRYRYEAPLGRTYSVTERIPRRSGLESAGALPPSMPEPVSRRLESLGPEYRERSVAIHAQPSAPSLRNTTPSAAPVPTRDAATIPQRSSAPTTAEPSVRRDAIGITPSVIPNAPSRSSESPDIDRNPETTAPVTNPAPSQPPARENLQAPARTTPSASPAVSPSREDDAEDKPAPKVNKPAPASRSSSSTGSATKTTSTRTKPSPSESDGSSPSQRSK